jgi:hypothetical protein
MDFRHARHFAYPRPPTNSSLLSPHRQWVETELAAEMLKEIDPSQELPINLFPTVQHIVLRAAFRMFVSPRFLDMDPSFMQEYMAFQVCPLASSARRTVPLR